VENARPFRSCDFFTRSKERSAWVSLMAMAIMDSQTVENAMHFQSNNQPFLFLFSLVDVLSSFVVSVVVSSCDSTYCIVL